MKTEILKAIEALTPLTKEQIAEQVDCLSSFLPEKIVERIKATDATTEEVEKWYNPYFHQEVGLAIREFESAGGDANKREEAKEKIFLLISVYYQYPECMDENIATNMFIFYVSKTK